MSPQIHNHQNILLALDITRSLYEDNTLFHEKTLIKLKRANLNRDDIFYVLSRVENIVLQFVKNVLKERDKFSIKDKLDRIASLKNKSWSTFSGKSKNTIKNAREFQVIRQRLVEEVSFIQTSIKECKKVLNNAFDDSNSYYEKKSYYEKQNFSTSPTSTSPSVLSDSNEETSDITANQEEKDAEKTKEKERKISGHNNSNVNSPETTVATQKTPESPKAISPTISDRPTNSSSVQKTRVLKKTRSDTYIVSTYDSNNTEEKRVSTLQERSREYKPVSPKRNLWVHSENVLSTSAEPVDTANTNDREKNTRSRSLMKPKTFTPVIEIKSPYSNHKKKLSLDSHISMGKSRRTYKYDKLRQIDTIFTKENDNSSLTKMKQKKSLERSSKFINITPSSERNEKMGHSAFGKSLLNRQHSAPPQKRIPNPLSPSKKRLSLPNIDDTPVLHEKHSLWGKRLSLNINRSHLTLSPNQASTKQRLNLMRVNNFIKEKNEHEVYNNDYLNEVKTKIIELNSRKTSATRKPSITSNHKNGKIPYLERNLIDRITHAIERDVKNLLIGDPALHQIFKNKDLCFVNLCNPNQTIQIGFNIINHYMDVNAHVNIENYHIMLGYNDIKEKNVTVQDLVADMEHYIKDLHMKLSENNKIHIYGLVPRFRNHIMNGRLKLFNEQMITKIRKLKLKQIVYYTRKGKFERDSSF